jgi:CubicO group peptidase (beta-lactamase class C family)
VNAARRRDAPAGASRSLLVLAVTCGSVMTRPPLLDAQRSSPADPATAAATRIDAIFAEFAAPGAPGAAVIVSRGDTIVLARAYGLADVDNRIRVTTATAFRLASVTKQFTAAAILALVEDGRLHLDDRLADLLPDPPRYAHDVRLRHLLAHTSGVPDYEALLGNGDGPQLTDRDVLTLLHQAKTLYFAPGTAWRYSNSAYALLALIVERASGERFAAFLRRRIFDRAGMPTAVAHEEGQSVVRERAYGHSLDRDVWRRTDQSRTSAVLGDGGIYASAVELARWSAALDRNTVLGAETFAQATTPVTLASGEPTHYGFGWFLDTHRGHRRQRHEGDSIGFRTAIQRYPDVGLTVIVLVNRGAAPIDALSDAVADLFLGS